MDKFIAWVVEKNFFSVRSFMLYVAVWMTYTATRWGAHYAEATKLTSGTDIGLVIAAATGPVTLFTSFVYKWYTDSRPTA